MSDRFTNPPERPISIAARAIMARDAFSLLSLEKRLITEAEASGLPGLASGPGDVYRHALLAGELTLRYGPDRANELLELNEKEKIFGVVPYGPMSDIDTAMDRTVNPMLVEAMRGAKTPEDVRRIARQQTLEAIRNNGTGANGSIPYLPEHHWHPKRFRDGRHPTEIPREWRPLGDRRGELGINPRLANMALDVPFELWTQAHVRAVMQDPRYYRDHPERKARTALVTRWFEAKYDGGPVQVDAYTRGDGTQVAAHTRASPRA
jgi:hypothetical protein